MSEPTKKRERTASHRRPKRRFRLPDEFKDLPKVESWKVAFIDRMKAADLVVFAQAHNPELLKQSPEEALKRALAVFLSLLKTADEVILNEKAVHSAVRTLEPDLIWIPKSEFADGANGKHLPISRHEEKLVLPFSKVREELRYHVDRLPPKNSILAKQFREWAKVDRIECVTTHPQGEVYGMYYPRWILLTAWIRLRNGKKRGSSLGRVLKLIT